VSLASLNEISDAFVVEDDSVMRGGEFCRELLVDVISILHGFGGAVREEENEELAGPIPGSCPLTRGGHPSRRLRCLKTDLCRSDTADILLRRSSVVESGEDGIEADGLTTEGILNLRWGDSWRGGHGKLDILFDSGDVSRIEAKKSAILGD